MNEKYGQTSIIYMKTVAECLRSRLKDHKNIVEVHMTKVN